MAYPNVIYGDYGDEKVAQSTKIGSLPLGQLMILPDGRKFRHSRAGAASLEAGVVVSTTAGVTGHGANVAGSGLKASSATTDNLAGATAVVLLAKTVAFTKNQYEDGFLSIDSPAASTMIGHIYKIKSNKSCAAAATLNITLYQTDPLKVSLAPVTTLCALRKSTYDDAIVAATAPVGPLIGTTPVAVSTTHYFWAQRSGPASLQEAVTVCVAGSAVMVGLEAGSVTLGIAASIIAGQFIGQAMGTAAAASCVIVNLTLE